MAVNGNSLLWELSPCLHPHMAGTSENPLFWCGGCVLCLIGTIQGLAVGTGLGMMLPLTLHCVLVTTVRFFYQPDHLLHVLQSN